PRKARVARRAARHEEVMAPFEESVEQRPGAVLAEPEADVRMGRTVGADQLRHEPGAEGVEEREADLAGLGVGGAPHRRFARIDLAERTAGVLGEAPAVRIGLERAPDAVEQAHAEARL